MSALSACPFSSGPDQERGRGLFLVHWLSDAWGVMQGEGGKVAWSLVPTPGELVHVDPAEPDCVGVPYRGRHTHARSLPDPLCETLPMAVAIGGLPYPNGRGRLAERRGEPTRSPPAAPGPATGGQRLRPDSTGPCTGETSPRLKPDLPHEPTRRTQSAPR
jgi:hypothetical protein